MNAKPFEDYDEEELEMLINGLIHPDDMFVSPDMLGTTVPGAFPSGVPGSATAGAPGGSFDAMIAQAYEDLDED